MSDSIDNIIKTFVNLKLLKKNCYCDMQTEL